jgi:hypothetical protein
MPSDEMNNRSVDQPNPQQASLHNTSRRAIFRQALFSRKGASMGFSVANTLELLLVGVALATPAVCSNVYIGNGSKSGLHLPVW